METQVIKTEVNLSFWIWNAKSGIRRFKKKWSGYIQSLETKWSIFKPLKVKVKVLVIYEVGTEKSIHENSRYN
ncbi:hypothetical protein LCGC14_2348490 [marine sediment metagenome]|uniref:Uncharacterized protein n=1 Tax=marine sediment metagenome TaxID=412755 RepID=A0A0F9C9S6_9ZZZZ